ncbi:MAG TPA: pyridoxal-dependent decarboxylase [Rhizomicrobium sp.]|nr:pyridoxal-dependent decarboxylase [Rhizomicrobium sp.]
MSEDRQALERAVLHAFDHLDGLQTDRVGASVSLSHLRQALHRPLPETGTPAARVIDELVADTRGGILGSQGGRFFGWVIGGGLPAAMAADWLTTVWDQNAGIHAAGPAAAVVEEIAGAWLRELFELPFEASFAFTTGTQMGHVTCLAAARHAVLSARGWDVAQKGMFGAPAIRILSSAERHGSVDRATRLLGFGAGSIEPLAVDADGRVRPETLDAALARCDAPAIVVLQAGELNLAAFDPFETLVPIARARGAWIHVDGAFGLWAKLCPDTRHLVRGIELCDSWTSDGHKYLNVPYDCGFAFVRDAAAHRAAMSLAASYLPAAGGARDQLDWNPEFSRRARGFPVYAALRQLGREGLSDLVARTCRYARAIAEGIGSLDGAELIAVSGLNQALVGFLSEKPDATPADHDARTDQVIAAVNASGEALFGGVTWRGRRAMRISVCNWRTTERDVERSIAAVANVLACGR